MINKFKEFNLYLSEEINYHENISKHKKNLEATLWGLEEQASFPENSPKEDQTELGEEMNKCRIKIMNCNKLISSHLEKLKDTFKNYSLEA